MRFFPRGKHRLINWYERQLRAEFAEEAAAAIMVHVTGPPAYCTDEGCPDHVRYHRAEFDAAIVLAYGYGLPPPAMPANEPGCSPAGVPYRAGERG